MDDTNDIEQRAHGLLSRVQADRLARPEVYAQRRADNEAALAELESGRRSAVEGVRTWEGLARTVEELLAEFTTSCVRPALPHESVAEATGEGERAYRWRVPESGVDEEEFRAALRLVLRDASALAAAYSRAQDRLTDEVEDLRSVLDYPGPE